MANAPGALQGRAVRLLCGAIAGPLFASGFTAIGAVRTGYDWQQLPVSSLALGRHGWLQRINFVVGGVLYACAAGGLRRSTSRRVGPRAVPTLVAGVGVGLIGSGLFVTDPVGDFPPGPPGGPGLEVADPGTTAPTLAGRLHVLFAIPVFVGIPVAAIASSATAIRERDHRWACYSAGSGLAMFGSSLLFGAAFGRRISPAGKGGIFQRLSIGAGFGWLTALSIRALSSPAD